MNRFRANILTTPAGMVSNEWRKPFNLSLVLHVLILALAMLSPALFHRQPELPEIYTVNLFSAVEVAEPEAQAPRIAAPKPVPKPAVKEVEPETTKPVVSVQPAEPESAAPMETVIAKPVSLAPRKQKIKVGMTPEEEARERAKLNKIVERLKAGAARKEAREEADAAAKDAVSKLADALKTTTAAATGPAAKPAGQTTTAVKTAAISGPGKTGIELDFYMKQYLAAVQQQITEHWILPELQNWDSSLEAVLVIAVRRDRVVTDSFFEKKSKNIHFNQFVLKTVKDAAPLPPFPDKLPESNYEIGLKFTTAGAEFF